MKRRKPQAGLPPRTAVTRAASPMNFEADAVLLDIEGTISPLSFVRDVLFPYARAHLDSFVDTHRGDAEVAQILNEASDLANGGSALAALHDWQDRDVKAPPLKKLQGLIWKDGYRAAIFKSLLFPDALAAMRRWKAAGLHLYVYSSGSLQAQLLFFEFNTEEDLRPLFSGFFDTGIGSKLEAKSYAQIAERIDTNVNRIVFFSDNAGELDAAREAGLQTCLVAREEILSAPGFTTISSFGEVRIKSARQVGKRESASAPATRSS